MYCTTCGTINAEGANFCTKCGLKLGEIPKTTELGSEDFKFTAAPPKTEYWRPKTISTRFILFTLAFTLSAVIPGVVLFTQVKNPGAVKNLSTIIGEATRMGGMPAVTGDSESFSPSGERSGGGITLPNPTDLQRRVDGQKLQMVIAQFYAQNERLPEALSELPPDMVDFKLDPEVFEYEKVEEPLGFRIKIVMISKYPAEENMINEGNVSKLVLQAAL